MLSIVPPVLALAWMSIEPSVASWAWFTGLFAVLGAAGNGATIAQLGYLMEISPDDRRPAYSGYFNALIAPATLLPLLGAFVVRSSALGMVFSASVVAIVLQALLIRALRREIEGDSHP